MTTLPNVKSMAKFSNAPGLVTPKWTRKCVYETLCPQPYACPKKGSSQKGVQLKP